MSIQKDISIPKIIKIMRDIDLIDDEESIMPEIFFIEQITELNYKDLIYFDDDDGFEYIRDNYTCDVCGVKCSQNNPIYTNNEYSGADICTICINTAFTSIQPIAEFLPEKIYSLAEICILNSEKTNIKQTA